MWISLVVWRQRPALTEERKPLATHRQFRLCSLQQLVLFQVMWLNHPKDTRQCSEWHILNNQPAFPGKTQGGHRPSMQPLVIHSSTQLLVDLQVHVFPFQALGLEPARVSLDLTIQLFIGKPTTWGDRYTMDGHTYRYQTIFTTNEPL